VWITPLSKVRLVFAMMATLITLAPNVSSALTNADYALVLQPRNAQDVLYHLPITYLELNVSIPVHQVTIII